MQFSSKPQVSLIYLYAEKERDEYLRNTCDTANKFIIIELCETVQPIRLELANFELFSSGYVFYRELASAQIANC